MLSANRGDLNFSFPTWMPFVSLSFLAALARLLVLCGVVAVKVDTSYPVPDFRRKLLALKIFLTECSGTSP
jgi:hypothetical protein